MLKKNCQPTFVLMPWSAAGQCERAHLRAVSVTAKAAGPRAGHQACALIVLANVNIPFPRQHTPPLLQRFPI